MLNLKTHIARFTNPLYLESGRILEPYEIAYETYGELNEAKDNVIVVCHALTGSHHAAGIYEGDSKAGWWDALIGDGKTIDTHKYFVICTNVLGSCFGSTGPMSDNYPSTEPFRYKFPVLSMQDMVKAQYILFQSLGIHSVQAVIGGSMGGMQAMIFAIAYPNFSKRTIVLASTYASSAYAIAFNKVSSSAILNDPLFNKGYYKKGAFKESGLPGMAVGRMAGHISFLSHDSMEKKFGRDYVQNDGLYELFGRFEIERYLEYNGYSFTRYFDPLSYLYITKAINIYDLARGSDSLSQSIGNIVSKLTLISFSGDLLFLPKESLHIHEAMIANKKEHLSTYIEVPSKYGHDAFLVEFDRFKHHIKDALDE